MIIEKVYNIMSEIQSESGRNAKKDLLKKYEGDTDFREALEFLLNPYIVTGLSSKKMKKRFKASEIEEAVKDESISSLKSLVEYLKVNNTGRDIDVKRIQHFIASHNEDVGEFIYKLATKSLKLGITEKTVNEVYGEDTIPTFDVMLAEKYADKADSLTGKFYITQKLDGNRCIAIKEDGDVKFFTRKGQPISDMNELANEFKKLPDNMVYDGEVLIINKDNLPTDQLFRATQKVVRKDGEKKGLEFYVFDALPVSEFRKGKSKKTYEQRRNNLELIFNQFGDNELIHLLPVLYEGENKQMISVLMKFAEEKGWEGLMINSANGLYQTRRVADLLKVKEMKSADLLCIGLEEGTGRNKGRLGAILVEYKGGVTKVGSGFTDEEREKYWANNDDIVGNIVEVQYFEESKDEKTQQVSMRFPIFKTVRHDKGIDDIRYE